MKFKLNPKKNWRDNSGLSSVNILGWIVIIIIAMTLLYYYVPEFQDIIDDAFLSGNDNPLSVYIDSVQGVTDGNEYVEIFPGDIFDNEEYDHINIYLAFNLAKGQYETIQEGSPTVKLFRDGVEVDSSSLDVVGEWVLSDAGWWGLWATVASGAVYIITNIDGEHTAQDYLPLGEGAHSYYAVVYSVNGDILGDTPNFSFICD